MATPNDANDEEIGRALREWYQGDCVVGEQGFFYQAHPDHPSVPNDVRATRWGSVTLEEEVVGLVVLTQTCDIVRDHTERPFIEVSPLVEVDESDLYPISQCHRPKYAFIPRLEEQRLVADLDRVMTIDKRVMVQWDRIPGCTTDDERYSLAQALARKRSRFAFPDDFDELVKPLYERMLSKHDKKSDEGEALRNLGEVRVRARPSWTASKVRLEFLFIPKEEQPLANRPDPAGHLDAWLNLIPASGRFVEVEGSVAELEGIPSSDYVKSMLLDLGHLTSRAP